MRIAVPLVIFAVFKWHDPRWVSPETRAVSGHVYKVIDDDAGAWGGITYDAIQHCDIRPLRDFACGSEVFLEADHPGEVLDDDDPEASRIWWRALLVTCIISPGGSS